MHLGRQVAIAATGDVNMHQSIAPLPRLKTKKTKAKLGKQSTVSSVDIFQNNLFLLLLFFVCNLILCKSVQCSV